MSNNFQFNNAHKEYLAEFFDCVDAACYALQEGTGCPDEAIDQLLMEAIGSWQIPNLAELDQALKAQELKT
ncbi:hypothetical protein [Prochlorococcus sp. MIT 1223]|uniref:hypothetical protein n=1 Tax=Prochlorococcus sp. MIT 1223 TaxID=3096217 RepID=UPI002A75D0EA|nr:hypothetical protein [Prochlorococcus sp. MIT 1223]